METARQLRPRILQDRMILWLCFLVLCGAMLWWLPATALSCSLALGVAASLVLCDAALPQEKRFRGTLGVSFFVCAMAYVLAAGYFALSFSPSALPATGSSGLQPGSSGGFLESLILAIIQEIAAALEIIVSYVLAIVACTVVSTVIALAAIRRHPESRWLLLMNAPGILLALSIVWEEMLTG